MKSEKNQRDFNIFIEEKEKEFGCKVISSPEAMNMLWLATVPSLKRLVKAGKIRATRYRHILYYAIDDVKKVAEEDREEIKKRANKQKEKRIKKALAEIERWERRIAGAKEKLQQAEGEDRFWIEAFINEGENFAIPTLKRIIEQIPNATKITDIWQLDREIKNTDRIIWLGSDF